MKDGDHRRAHILRFPPVHRHLPVIAGWCHSHLLRQAKRRVHSAMLDSGKAELMSRLGLFGGTSYRLLGTIWVFCDWAVHYRR